MLRSVTDPEAKAWSPGTTSPHSNLTFACSGLVRISVANVAVDVPQLKKEFAVGNVPEPRVSVCTAVVSSNPRVPWTTGTGVEDLLQAAMTRASAAKATSAPLPRACPPRDIRGEDTPVGWST